MKVEDVLDRLRDVYGGRDWIIASDVMVAAGHKAAVLEMLGATGAFCIAASKGTGKQPELGFIRDMIALDVRGTSIMDGLRASDRALNALSKEIVARVDAFDPSGDVTVLRDFYSAGQPVAGRAVFGARRPEWCALENKMTVDGLWDAVGVPRAPSAIVTASGTALREAATSLDVGLGTVWVGDNREGWHGGGEYLRWVRSDADVAEASAFFEARCDKVRVMPFMEGIPCSIHAVVFESETIVFRPCEMVVLRKPGRSDLHYARAATFWDPPEADRAHMRRWARAVGDHLRESVGYRGMFTMDGVMTEDGFRPTELNPRLGAAAGLLLSGLPEKLPLNFVNMAIVEGVSVDWQPAALERLVLDSADAHRFGSGVAHVDFKVEEAQRIELAFDEDRGAYRMASEGEPRDVSLNLGPATMGGYLGVVLASDRQPVGPSIAPRIAAALQFADAHWNLGIGPLEAARSVR